MTRISKKLQEPFIDTINYTSEKKTKTITETSISNKKAIENLNEKVLELMNDRGIITSDLAIFLVNVFKPANKSQFNLKNTLNRLS